MRRPVELKSGYPFINRELVASVAFFLRTKFSLLFFVRQFSFAPCNGCGRDNAPHPNGGSVQNAFYNLC